MEKKNVPQADTLVGRNESDWSTFPGWFSGTLRGGEGRGTFRSAFWIQCLEVFVWSSPVLKPRGGLYIFTYRDQRSILGVLNFENLYFFWYWSELLYFLGVVKQMLYF